MRILNRPMFRSGGPINEGVMHGMRNNYQSGQLVRPGPGRPGYQGEGFWQKLAAQYNPKNFASPKKFFKRINPFKKLKTATKVAPLVTKGLKDLRGIFTQTGTGSGITSSPAATTFMQNLRSFPGASKIGGWATKAKDVALKYPKSTAAATLYGGVPLATSLPYKKIASTIADVAVPDQIYNWETGRWFNSDDTDLKPSDKKILEEKKTEIIETGVPGGGDRDMTYTDPDAAKKLAQQKQNERLKSYLDMMGYDSAKKGALSDALIDASAIVQDATTEAGSLKKADWGNLINKMIQTTSKRLDKPAQIREAVGLMMTKGAIEKDIADAKGTPLDIKEKYLKGKLGPVAGERGALNKPTSLAEAVNLTKATDTTGNRTNQALRHYYDGHLVPSFEGKISKKKVDALGGDEVFEEGMEIGLGDGVYQISNSYIIVKGNKIIERDDVFASEK